LGSPAVEIASQIYFHESEGEYVSTTIFMPAHTATHIDLIFADRKIDVQQMIGKGKLIDVTQISRREIEKKDIVNQVEIQQGDFVFFRTDWTNFIDSEKYYKHPELASDLIQWLISKKINMIGIDASGLGQGRKHGEYDRLLARNDVYILENLTNLAAIPQSEFTVYCFPLHIDNIDAIPARVVVEV
jgi:kynurenine formamidase